MTADQFFWILARVTGLGSYAALAIALVTGIALLLFGIRYEGQNLLEQMRKEAATGQGAILPEDVAILSSPWQRLKQRLQAFSRAGLKGYLEVSRLQTAQLDLAMERWHRERKEIDTPLEAEQRLRERVIQLRHWVAAG